MDRIDRIIHNQEYMVAVEDIAIREKEREFCIHDRNHILAVARIAWILNLEKQYSIEKEIVYAAALLHDCGRGIQYETGEAHEEAGAKKAGTILRDTGFSESEAEEILHAIRFHRNKDEAMKRPLSEIIYLADKASRECFWCEVRERCNRLPEKRTKKLEF